MDKHLKEESRCLVCLTYLEQIHVPEMWICLLSPRHQFTAKDTQLAGFVVPLLLFGLLEQHQIDHVTPFLKALQRRLIVFSTESNLLVTAYKVLLGLVSAPPPPCTCVLQGVHTHVCAHRPGLKPTPPQGGSRVASSQPALWRHTPSQRCGTHLGSRRPIPAFSRPGPLSPTLSPAPWSLSTWVHSSGTAIGRQPWLQFHREPDP